MHQKILSVQACLLAMVFSQNGLGSYLRDFIFMLVLLS